MTRYLITQSLLSAWNYTYTCGEEYADEAMASFLSTLHREETAQTEAMQNGIEFENAVYAEASGQLRPPHPKWERGIVTVAELLKGAQFQVRVQREIEVAGMTFLVYGVLDGLRAGTIFDVKFKNESFSQLDLPGNYFDSPQHPFYFYMVPEAREFLYLVSDGNDLYIERYTPEETVKAESLILEFLQFLEAANMLAVYKAHWQAAA